MKTIQEFALDQIPEIVLPLEESDAASSTTGGVAAPDAKPLGSTIKRSTVFGKPCFEVDSDTYHKCHSGKIPFKRWSNYIEDEELRNEIKSAYQKNKKVLIQDSKSGGLVYIK